MSLRAAINQTCHACVVDPLDRGSAAQQIACCTISDCPLHPVRPVTATVLPDDLLAHWGIKRSDLCERAQKISPHGKSEIGSTEGQINPPQSKAGAFGGAS